MAPGSNPSDGEYKLREEGAEERGGSGEGGVFGVSEGHPGGNVGWALVDASLALRRERAPQDGD